MAITWGSQVADATNAFRIGYEFSQSPSTLLSSTSSVTVTLKTYFQSKYPIQDSSNDHDVSGNFSVTNASTSISTGSTSAWSSSNIVALRTLTRTVTPSYTATVTSSFSAALTGIDAVAGTATVSGSWVTGKRPVSAPAAPTGASATYVDDTKTNLAWTNTNPTSTSNPYTNLVIERSVDGASYATVATLGVVSSYQATGLAADHSYRFRVKATNAGGSSSYAYTSTIYTSPKAPTIGSATKSGADIVVTFDHTARYPTGAKVYASTGGGYTVVGTVSGTGESYTHVAPAPSSTWTYKVAATIGALESALSVASNTVQLQAPPNAPTLLAPVGAADATEGVTFQWQHNPVDTTPQSAYELQYRQSGGAWTTLTGTTAQSRTVAGLTNGLVYEWQVRTKGSDPTFSPYSTLGSFNTTARPTATINYPDGSDHPTSTLTVTWGYYDAEGTAQSQWRATLTNGTTTEVRSGSGTTGQATFATHLTNGTAWTVTVEVRDGAGAWSLPDTQAVDVVYAPPPAPTLQAVYTHETGSVALTVVNPAATAPEPNATHNDLYRSIDAGTTWALIGSQIPLDGSMVDPLPLIGGPTLYQAVAASATGTSATSITQGIDTTDPATHRSWCYANWGPGFTQGVRLRANVRVNSDREREKVLNHYSDREDPVEYAGTARTHTLTITGDITPGDESTRDELEALAEAPAPICWRDPTGRRLFCSSGRVSTSAFHMVQDAAVSLTKVHHVE